jgi:hypothetical protein
MLTWSTPTVTGAIPWPNGGRLRLCGACVKCKPETNGENISMLEGNMVTHSEQVEALQPGGVSESDVRVAFFSRLAQARVVRL